MADTNAELKAKLAEAQASNDALKAEVEELKAAGEDHRAQADVPAAERIADLEAENRELRGRLETQPTPDGGAISSDLPAARTPPGAAPFNPEAPEAGQYVGHGATSVASAAGTFLVDPASGLLTGPAKA